MTVTCENVRKERKKERERLGDSSLAKKEDCIIY